MPTTRKTDTKGSYYQWGSSGKKYYISQYGEAGARKKADEQGRAAYANGYKGKEKKSPKY